MSLQKRETILFVDNLKELFWLMELHLVLRVKIQCPWTNRTSFPRVMPNLFSPLFTEVCTHLGRKSNPPQQVWLSVSFPGKVISFLPKFSRIWQGFVCLLGTLFFFNPTETQFFQENFFFFWPRPGIAFFKIFLKISLNSKKRKWFG